MFNSDRVEGSAACETHAPEVMNVFDRSSSARVASAAVMGLWALFVSLILSPAACYAGLMTTRFSIAVGAMLLGVGVLGFAFGFDTLRSVRVALLGRATRESWARYRRHVWLHHAVVVTAGSVGFWWSTNGSPAIVLVLAAIGLAAGELLVGSWTANDRG